jgi:hypothetical protein
MPPGLPGSIKLRALDAGDDLWLIASSVPLRAYGEGALAQGLQDLEWVGRRAMAHEAIVERFLSAPALLPMQLFTLFTSDERAVEHVKRDRRRILRILKRIAGQVEWGLRLTWDEASVRKTVESKHRARTGRSPSGVAYLARKRDLLDVNRAQLRHARSKADRVYRDIARHATEARRRTSLERAAPGSRLLLDAAFMVPAVAGSAFGKVVRRSSKMLDRSGVAVSLTGPWPPYNFIGSR